MTMIATLVSFTACGDDDNGDNSDENTASCKSCDEIISDDIEIQVCDNGDDTAEVTVTTLGIETYSQEIDLDGASIEDYNCEDLPEFDF